MFTQVITRKQKTDGRTYEGRTDGRTDRHTDVQRETILPRHYWVAGYKKVEFGNKEHTTNQKMGVLVLLRLFISSNEACNTAYAL